MKKRRYRFFFHYNKLATAAAGSPRITLHFRNVCHLVENVRVLVPTEGKISDRQPRFVVQGWAESVELQDGIAVIS